MKKADSMKDILKKLKSFSKHHDVVTPISLQEIENFETLNKIILPKSLKELLISFDGGELFVPGTTFFVIGTNKKRPQLRKVNSKANRAIYTIPKNYLIIAKLNFGDFICINLNKPYDVIEWDHETDKLFCRWDSLIEFLKDSIASFEMYEESTL